MENAEVVALEVVETLDAIVVSVIALELVIGDDLDVVVEKLAEVVEAVSLDVVVEKVSDVLFVDVTNVEAVGLEVVIEVLDVEGSVALLETGDDVIEEVTDVLEVVASVEEEAFGVTESLVELAELESLGVSVAEVVEPEEAVALEVEGTDLVGLSLRAVVFVVVILPVEIVALDTD